MRWIEARERVGPEVVPDHIIDGGWPPPSDPDFWALAYPAEVAPLIRDQMPKWASRDDEVGVVIATAYHYNVLSKTPPTEDEIASILEEGKVFSEGVLEELLSGPMTSLLLTRFGIRREEQKRSYKDFVVGRQNLSEVSESWSDGMRALAWYALWLDCTKKSVMSRWSYSQGIKRVKPLTQGFGLTPPEII